MKRSRTAWLAYDGEPSTLTPTVRKGEDVPMVATFTLCGETVRDFMALGGESSLTLEYEDGRIWEVPLSSGVEDKVADTYTYTIEMGEE